MNTESKPTISDLFNKASGAEPDVLSIYATLKLSLNEMDQSRLALWLLSSKLEITTLIETMELAISNLEDYQLDSGSHSIEIHSFMADLLNSAGVSETDKYGEKSDAGMVVLESFLRLLNEKNEISIKCFTCENTLDFVSEQGLDIGTQIFDRNWEEFEDEKPVSNNDKQYVCLECSDLARKLAWKKITEMRGKLHLLNY